MFVEKYGKEKNFIIFERESQVRARTSNRVGSETRDLNLAEAEQRERERERMRKCR